MNAYRFSIPAEVCFSVEAKTEEEARKFAADAFLQWDEGCDLEVESIDEWGDKLEAARMYTDGNKSDNPDHLHLEYVEELEDVPPCDPQ